MHVCDSEHVCVFEVLCMPVCVCVCVCGPALSTPRPLQQLLVSFTATGDKNTGVILCADAWKETVHQILVTGLF